MKLMRNLQKIFDAIGSVLRYRNNLSLVQLEILNNDSDVTIASEARKQLKDRKS